MFYIYQDRSSVRFNISCSSPGNSIYLHGVLSYLLSLECNHPIFLIFRVLTDFWWGQLSVSAQHFWDSENYWLRFPSRAALLLGRADVGWYKGSVALHVVWLLCWFSTALHCTWNEQCHVVSLSLQMIPCLIPMWPWEVFPNLYLRVVGKMWRAPVSTTCWLPWVVCIH